MNFKGRWLKKSHAACVGSFRSVRQNAKIATNFSASSAKFNWNKEMFVGNKLSRMVMMYVAQIVKQEAIF